MKFNFESYQLYQDLMAKQKTLLSDLSTKNGGRGLIVWGLWLLRLIQAKAPTKSDVKIIKHFSRKCFHIARHSGLNHLVKYLKTCAIMLQQSVAHNEIRTDPRTIGKIAVSASRRGLPRIIPSICRRRIRKGCTTTIQTWLSLFNMYRYLTCSYKPVDFSGITNPGNGYVITEDIHNYIRIFAHHLKDKFGASQPLPKGKPFVSDKVSVSITKSTNLKGTSYVATLWSTWAWRNLGNKTRLKDIHGADIDAPWLHDPRETRLVKALSTVVKQCYPELLTILEGYLPDPSEELITESSKLPPILPPATVYPESGKLLGRIVLLREAAGKIRQIAIVDPLTQWALYPIHKYIFNILEKIPQDGTFEQSKPLSRVLSISRQSADKYLASLDMSDATNRLLVSLQERILFNLIGPLAHAWRDLLTCRPYWADNEALYYAVGQPMGALSSWAGLALTHHFLWQVAAWRSGYPTWLWYDEYAVVGDDGLSRNRAICEHYLSFAIEIGVDINLAKSLLSKNGCAEFIKQFHTSRGNCSPVSLGELCVSKLNFAVISNLPRKWEIRIADLLNIMGYRHRVTSNVLKRFDLLPRRLRYMLISLRSPWGSFPTKSLVEWLSLISVKRGGYPLDLVHVCICLIEMMESLNKKLLAVQYTHHLTGMPTDMKRRYIQRELNHVFPPDNKARSSYTLAMKRMDKNTVLAIHNTIYEKLRRENYVKAYRLQQRLIRYKEIIEKRCFFVNELEINQIFDDFKNMEAEFFNLNTNVYQQQVTVNERIPSPRRIVAMFNRFRG